MAQSLDLAMQDQKDPFLNISVKMAPGLRPLLGPEGCFYGLRDVRLMFMSHLNYVHDIGKDGVSPEPFEYSNQAYGSLAFIITSNVEVMGILVQRRGGSRPVAIATATMSSSLP